MSEDIGLASAFVESAVLPTPRPYEGNVLESAVPPLDAAREQAAVVGAEIVSFAKGVSRERRGDLLNASLFAQLVANKQVPEPKSLAEIAAWHAAYVGALSKIGFAVQSRELAEFHERSDDFEAHKAILTIAGELLVGSPGALTLLQTTLDALSEAAGDAPWIKLFNRESQSANAARFQVAIVDRDDSVALMAFGLEARANLTQVLFFKFRTNEVKLHHHKGRVDISTTVLDAVRDAIAARLVDYSSDYIRRLPDL